MSQIFELRTLTVSFYNLPLGPLITNNEANNEDEGQHHDANNANDDDNEIEVGLVSISVDGIIERSDFKSG